MKAITVPFQASGASMLQELHSDGDLPRTWPQGQGCNRQLSLVSMKVHGYSYEGSEVGEADWGPVPRFWDILAPHLYSNSNCL